MHGCSEAYLVISYNLLTHRTIQEPFLKGIPGPRFRGLVLITEALLCSQRWENAYFSYSVTSPVLLSADLTVEGGCGKEAYDRGLEEALNWNLGTTATKPSGSPLS